MLFQKALIQVCLQPKVPALSGVNVSDYNALVVSEPQPLTDPSLCNEHLSSINSREYYQIPRISCRTKSEWLRKSSTWYPASFFVHYTYLPHTGPLLQGCLYMGWLTPLSCTDR